MPHMTIDESPMSLDAAGTDDSKMLDISKGKEDDNEDFHSSMESDIKVRKSFTSTPWSIYMVLKREY